MSMKKLLILGINTRAIVKSALKLDYLTFSGSYFSTLDFNFPHKKKHILKQREGKSCQNFETNYSYEKLLEISKEMMDEVDHIVLSTGISPLDFKGEFKRYKKKIIGNQHTENLEDKYKFYKKIKNKFLTPETFKLRYENISEANEILLQHDDKEFIMKPLQGSGGYGVKNLNYDMKNDFKAIDFGSQIGNNEKSEFLIQEFIHGHNISSSVLGGNDEVKAIVNSRMLTETDFGIKNSFKYCGNIIPLDINSLKEFNNHNNYHINEKLINSNNINEISEELIAKFKLIGSNGVDMIVNNEGIYIIEVNPRFQGTYELIENVLNINLLEAHIKACNNELINIPKPKGYSIKRIIYSKEKSMIGKLAIENVYDIPYEGVIIEKDQPLATVITNENRLDIAVDNVNIATDKINKKINYIN